MGVARNLELMRGFRGSLRGESSSVILEATATIPCGGCVLREEPCLDALAVPVSWVREATREGSFPPVPLGRSPPLPPGRHRGVAGRAEDRRPTCNPPPTERLMP